MVPKKATNEIQPELMSLNALPGAPGAGISSARSLMYGSHLPQSVPISKITAKRIQNDALNSISEFDMNIQFPDNAFVIDVIYKFPKVFGGTRVNKSNINNGVVIYENPTTSCVVWKLMTIVVSILILVGIIDQQMNLNGYHQILYLKKVTFYLKRQVDLHLVNMVMVEKLKLLLLRFLVFLRIVLLLRIPH